MGAGLNYSAWGVSWLGSWGNSWGEAAVTAAAKSGGDDAWRKEKKRKKNDEYLENTVLRKKALIDAYNGLLDQQTPEPIAKVVESVVQSTPIVDLDLEKVRKLLKLWQDELDRREEQDDEEALLMLL